MKKLSVDRALLKAKSYEKKGEIEKAQIQYQCILQAFPKNERAKKGLAALEQLNPSIATHGPTQETINHLINLYNQGQLVSLVDQATKLTAQYPNAFFVWNILGAANKGLGQVFEASVAFKKVTELNPNFADGFNNLGVTLGEQGDPEGAISACKKALSLKPNYAEAYNNMAAALRDQNKLDEAIAAYNKALAIKPNYAEASYNKANALKDQGQIDNAIKAYNRAMEIKPDYAQAKHMLNSLTGKTTDFAPREYVENLFDGYAEKFDQALVKKLEYKLPQVLTQIALKTHCGGSIGSVLDMGCGTGLTGQEVREFCSNLEGVDVSKKMLQKAKEKGVYDKLKNVDIIEYLSVEELRFDYFFSADVFIYIGELSEIFRLIKSKNKKPGKLVFSTEHSEKKGFHLESSGRYSHSKSYIEVLCRNFNFSMSHFSTTNLRKENGVFLTGGIYVLDF